MPVGIFNPENSDSTSRPMFRHFHLPFPHFQPHNSAKPCILPRNMQHFATQNPCFHATICSILQTKSMGFASGFVSTNIAQKHNPLTDNNLLKAPYFSSFRPKPRFRDEQRSFSGVKKNQCVSRKGGMVSVGYIGTPLI